MTRTTFLDFATSQAEAEAEAGQGRFKKEQPTVIGTGTPAYPRLPGSSPWANPDHNVEPPLGIDVNELPGPLGGASAPAVTPSADETASPERGEAVSPSTASPQPIRRRR